MDWNSLENEIKSLRKEIKDLRKDLNDHISFINKVYAHLQSPINRIKDWFK
tara:strand:+ start:448 stop:600 length:153 start_codon:yes stop_codon:yes gene_type:complete